MKSSIIILMGVFLTHLVIADSPITSTFFAVAYTDIPLVKEVLAKKQEKNVAQIIMTENHLHFFDDVSISLDQKVALINALGWGESYNLQILKTHLTLKYQVLAAVIDSVLQLPLSEDQEFYSPAQAISNADLTILAYVQVMHDYFNPMKGYQCGYRALINNPESEATAYVFGLLLSQYYMDLDFCSVYMVMTSVRNAGTYSKDLLKQEAVTSIFDYINIYLEACENEAVTDEEFSVEENVTRDDIYTSKYWQENPVYTKPMNPQISEKTSIVDLVLINSSRDKNPMIDRWVFFDESTNGTSIQIEIKNNGSIPSIETNIQLKIDNTSEYESARLMYIQEKIPAIPAGQTVTVKIKIPNYWIYDPNADFFIYLDFDNNIREFDEENNRGEFHEWG